MNLKSVILNNMLRKGAKRLSILGVLCLALGLTSCESIYDDDPNCLHGVALRFVYDYHMEPGANSFPANVDCINVFVFDENGNCMAQFKETSDVLRSEGYRMDIPLYNGKYTIIAYGGMACEHSSFNLTPDWRASDEFLGTKKDDLVVTLPLDNGVSNTQLHNIDKRTGGLFFSQPLEVELTDADYNTTYKEETMYMMNDVNDIQIILQELDAPYTANYEDYDFKIIDDNFVIDSKNDPIHIATDEYQPYYLPYETGNRFTGAVKNLNSNGARLEEDEDLPVQVACADFSTSRLFNNKHHLENARLVITSQTETDNNGNPRTIIDIPLIQYLLLIRGFGDTWIKTDQEFLDRQSRWTLMFFLQHGLWVSTRVSVNAWIVRINDIEL